MKKKISTSLIALMAATVVLVAVILTLSTTITREVLMTRAPSM